MALRLENLLREAGVRVAGVESRHYRDGWVHVNCPKCSDHSAHCGAPVVGWTFHCFKCGNKSSAEDILRRAGLSAPRIRELVEKHRLLRGVPRGSIPKREQAEEIPEVDLGRFEVAGQREFNYLRRRWPDAPPEWIDAEMTRWDMRSGGNVGRWGDRLIIPIHDEEGRPIGWTARYLGNHPQVPRYLTEGGSAIKRVVLGLHLITERPTAAFVVEGPLDAVRLGAGNAVSLMGAGWTPEQLEALLRAVRVPIILMDPDATGRAAGEAMALALSALGSPSLWIQTEEESKRDPGAYTESDRDDALEVLFRSRRFIHATY